MITLKSQEHTEQRFISCSCYVSGWQLAVALYMSSHCEVKLFFGSCLSWQRQREEWTQTRNGFYCFCSDVAYVISAHVPNILNNRKVSCLNVLGGGGRWDSGMRLKGNGWRKGGKEGSCIDWWYCAMISGELLTRCAPIGSLLVNKSIPVF